MITMEMTLLEIVEKYPETESVFREYDVVTGKCLLCHNLFDSLSEVVHMYDLHSDELMKKLLIRIIVNKVIG